MQAVQGVVAHEGDFIQVQDAGITEIPVRIARDDSLAFPMFPLHLG